MRKFYRGILSIFENLIVLFEVNKMRISENIALLKKKKLYKDVQWSTESKNEFNAYWKEHYGHKITPKGHKLYEAINDTHHKDYIPDFLYATKVEPYFNPYFYAKLYSDKSLTEILYAKSKLVKFPATYLVNSGGILYDGERNIITKDKAKTILSSTTEAVIKPTVGGNSGKGVMVCSFQDGFDNSNNYNIFDLLEEDNKDYIVQERMKQHETIAKIYNSSINTFRTITYVVDGVVYCADLAMRIGAGGAKIDNIHAGGLVIGVKDDGTLLKNAYKLGYSDSNQKFEKHPDSGVVFENYKVCGAEKIIECAKEIHGLTPHLGMISWDFMVSEDGNPVLIEANYWGQSVWFPQIVHGKPFFGDQTKLILSKIKNK